MNVRKLPAMDSRVETGPTQFGDDWPGVFIRGDNAACYAHNLRNVLKHSTPAMDPISVYVLQGLLSDLESCIVK